MVIISDRLYVGASIEDVKKDVIKGLKKKQFQPGLYCITLPQEDGNILDIRRAATLRDYTVKAGKISLGLRFKKSTVDDIIVVGIALGRSEAIDGHHRLFRIYIATLIHLIQKITLVMKFRI